jgi:hypothetical protein
MQNTDHRNKHLGRDTCVELNKLFKIETLPSFKNATYKVIDQPLILTTLFIIHVSTLATIVESFLRG